MLHRDERYRKIEGNSCEDDEAIWLSNIILSHDLLINHFIKTKTKKKNCLFRKLILKFRNLVAGHFKNVLRLRTLTMVQALKAMITTCEQGVFILFLGFR